MVARFGVLARVFLVRWSVLDALNAVETLNAPKSLMIRLLGL